MSGIGAQLTDELPKDKINYGHLQVTFEDGSVGWYEAGWGPMMSETAFFVKDVVGPLGSASIVAAEAGSRGNHLMSMLIAKRNGFFFIEVRKTKMVNWKQRMNTLI